MFCVCVVNKEVLAGVASFSVYRIFCEVISPVFVAIREVIVWVLSEVVSVFPSDAMFCVCTDDEDKEVSANVVSLSVYGFSCDIISPMGVTGKEVVVWVLSVVVYDFPFDAMFFEGAFVIVIVITHHYK